MPDHPAGSRWCGCGSRPPWPPARRRPRTRCRSCSPAGPTGPRRVTGRDPAAITEQALRHRPGTVLRHDQVSPTTVDRLGALVVDGLLERRSTWTVWNARAEAARATRGLRMASAGDRVALLDRVTTAALARSASLAPVDPVPVVEGFTRPDGTSVFSRPDEHRYTDPRLLAAETRLLQAHETQGAPTVPEHIAHRLATTPQPPTRRGDRPVRLAEDQVHAVLETCTSGRTVDVLVGPAGTGKTTTLIAIRAAWETVHGRGSVIGLAPSATAAAELATALSIPCENTAKWLHEADGPGAAHRTAVTTGLRAALPAAAAAADYPRVRQLRTAIAVLDRDQAGYRFRPGQLVIVDEASLAATLDLDRLRAHAADAGAKLLLVGDHHQLSAVGAGGAFGLLAETGRPAQLHSLWRFTHRWEAHATRRLRTGDRSRPRRVRHPRADHRRPRRDDPRHRVRGVAGRHRHRPGRPAHRRRQPHRHRAQPARPRGPCRHRPGGRAHRPARRRDHRRGPRPRRGRRPDPHPARTTAPSASPTGGTSATAPCGPSPPPTPTAPSPSPPPATARTGTRITRRATRRR